MVVDRLTKYGQCFALPTKFNAPIVAEVFLEKFLDFMGCKNTSLVIGTTSS